LLEFRILANIYIYLVRSELREIHLLFTKQLLGGRRNLFNKIEFAITLVFVPVIELGTFTL